MNRNSTAAMIIKTIATDRQLDTGKGSPTRRNTQPAIEKSYLRSQFERRQRRQIELTNKMHQPSAEGQHPDLVVSSHELAKRRFFDQLERRESINSARATQQAANVAQLHQRAQHQQQRPIQARPMKENGLVECTIKVDVNEPDGAGTDADEATSLETIITNNSSQPNGARAAPPKNLCKTPAPPLDNSKIRDGQQVQQVELRVSTSVEDGCDGRAQQADEAANVEQSEELPAQELQSGRQPSKGEDLRDRPQPIDDKEMRQQCHERLRAPNSHQRDQAGKRQQGEQQQQEQQQREQYANPRSCPYDSAQGNHENQRLSGNNVNHDQYDGHHGLLSDSQAAQVFTGMQFDGEKEGINLLGHDLDSAPVDLLQQQQQKLSFKSPDQDREVRHEHENGEQICDTVQRCPPYLMSSTINRAQEEDVRSSCSSSGFGASASSSSEGQPERNSRHHLSFDRHLEAKGHEYGANEQSARIGSSVKYETFPLDNEFHLSQNDKALDEISQFEIFVGRLDGGTAANLNAQALSVGPDQAPDTDDDRPMLHVENHGYGSLGNERLMIMKAEVDLNYHQTKTTRNQADKRRWPLVNPDDFAPELDSDSGRQYVNLPAATSSDNRDSLSYPMRVAGASASATAGYAVVRARPTSLVDMDSRGQAGAGSANMPPAGNNGHSAATSHDHKPGVLPKPSRHDSDGAHNNEPEDCGSNASEHNSSTSSASTGGFSKLPPVRLIDHHFANNFQSSSSAGKAPLEPRTPPARMEESNSMQQHQLQSKKSASLFKRFGSLVSRAFTSSNNFGADSNSGIRGSANNFGSQRTGGIDQSCAQVNGARLENYKTSSSAIPPLERRNNSHELTEGISCPPLREHKSMEFASGVHKEDHQDQHAKQSRAPNQSRVQQQQHQQKQTLDILNQARDSVANAKSLVVAEADLVILSAKHSRSNRQSARNKPTVGTNDYYAPKSRRNTIEMSRCANGKQSGRARRCTSRNEQPSNKGGALLSRRSASSASCSSCTSLDKSSLTCSSTQDLSHWEAAQSSRRQSRRTRLHLRRVSSLSDELESLISPSEVGSLQRSPADDHHLNQLDKCDKNSAKQSQRSSLSKHDRGASRGALATEATNCANNNPPLAQRDDGRVKSRSIMRWFSVNGSAGSSPSPLGTNDDCNSIQYDPSWPCRDSHALRSGRGRYSESKSLIDHSHANGDLKLACPKRNGKFASLTSRLQRRSSIEINGDNGGGPSEIGQSQPISLVYSSLNLPGQSKHDERDSKQRRGYWLKRTDEDTNNESGDKLRENELVVNDGKCQSLNLYQNLLRNYVKRRNHHHHHHHRHHRHHNRGHHSHHHHHAHSSHHHHHHHNRSSSSRHALCSSSTATATRCGQQQQRCASHADRACSCSSDELSNAAAGNGKTHGDTASVWGQLIKINKSDGSQVIELQRAPGRSWGFFVARGAINNKKGIFISRMHDSSSGGRSLSGLLSVGDRILSIDNYHTEPDFDILRVNQMISKKSRIYLEVKPFKG